MRFSTLLLTALAVLALSPASTIRAAELTKDSLQTVKKNVAEEKAVLVDVREKAEWDGGHIEGSIFLPTSSLRRGVKKEDLARRLPEDRILYTFCVVGKRAVTAGNILEKFGRVHHSHHVNETNSNFGFNLPWWDRLFGTYRDQPADGHTAMAIGLAQFTDERQADRLHWMLWLPFGGEKGDYPINRRDSKRKREQRQNGSIRNIAETAVSNGSSPPSLGSDASGEANIASTAREP